MQPSRKTITVALAGNPNSGKTTVFNRLTGSRQHVGNYPGVTVEKKEGYREHRGHTIKIVDLPGTYSLTAHSVEELIARNFVAEEKPDVVVDIVDATNVERNLYLAVQFMELGVPLVLALNMSDLAGARGYKIDSEKLGMLLGCVVIPTVATKGGGMQELLDAVVEMASQERRLSPASVKYGREIEEEVGKLIHVLREFCGEEVHQNHRWLAVKLLENDAEVQRSIRDRCRDGNEILAAAGRSSRHLERIFGDVPEIIIADRRYGFISGACRESVQTTVQSRYDMSERIDSVLTNRLIGLPLFFALMYLVFQFTFALGDPVMGLLEKFFSWVGGVLSMLWPRASESALRSLLVDGVIGGVGSVISFLPNILFLFLAIALLEDSGYMARAAFMMDRVMHKVGLHGKSFIPMLIGFGCSVPAIMATRTLENRTDRLTTILVIPLISCGARLTIYLLIIPAFFPLAWRARILWIMYLIGIILAMLVARLIRSTLLKGEATPFVMELPPYRMPTIRGIAVHMAERSWVFLKKAGTIILGISIVLWALTSYPRKQTFRSDYEARLARSEREAVAKARTLNPILGLSADSETLAKTLEADFEITSEQNQYFRHQKEFRRAEKKRRDLKEGLKATPEGAIVSEFLRVRDGAETKHPSLRNALAAYRDRIESPLQKAKSRILEEKRAEEVAYSMAGRIGQGLEPILKPIGFDWRIGTAFLGAFAAKEVFVSQMGIVFSVGDATKQPTILRQKLRRTYSALTGFCVLLFSLIAAPCMATLAVTRREAGHWKWALLQFCGLTVLGYVVTLLVYQVGSLLT
jgi:ferrous iron transport protein B